MSNPTNRKDQRNRSIIRYKDKHPNCSGESIGRIYHISRQRVLAIIKRYSPGTQGQMELDI